MVPLALLIVALVSVIIGVAAASVGWLIASLVASLLAALVLIRSWGTIKERRTQMARGSKPPRRSWWRGRKAAVVDSAAPAEPANTASGRTSGGAGPAGPQVVVVDGHPEYHAAGCARLAGLDAEPIPLGQAVEDGFTPCPVCSPPGAPDARSDPAVWVVDGSPEYHEQACSTLPGRDAEPIPLSQALEDGFVRCAVCTPPRIPAAATTAAADAREVWVADGYPEYHRAGCAELTGLEAEPIPLSQAVEDGFQPCLVCAPDAEVAPTGPLAPAAHAAAEAEVWVVDGEPDYHRPGCARLAGADGEPIPLAQAVEDGFAPCDVCVPDAQVWVADGFPDYHATGCRELNELDAEPIPLAQAVEDGFAPCPVCRPDGIDAVGPAPAEAVPEETGEVWVADGYPDYHRSGCVELVHLDAEPIPLAQAVEDGFAPCEVCKPQSQTEAAAERPPAPPAAAGSDAMAPDGAEQVWVVEGRPRYHVPDCLLIKGQRAQPIAFDDAVERGFVPCSLCRRGR